MDACGVFDVTLFDRLGMPIDSDDRDEVIRWAIEFQYGDRIVRQSRHKEHGREFILSTVFVGIDLGIGMGGPPRIYETMVFDLRPATWRDVHAQGRAGNECARWVSEDQARAGHDPWEMTA